MENTFDIHKFLAAYPSIEENIKKHNINIEDLKNIYDDYIKCRTSY
ncbi:MAG TPA: GTP pyrophosphokinase, partial [Clostridium sp.]|nr:GTP pyrophosphokinase [Clostridium sp.]